MSDIVFYNIIEIVLLLAACYACYIRGHDKGIEVLAIALLEHKIIKESDLEKVIEM